MGKNTHKLRSEAASRLEQYAHSNRQEAVSPSPPSPSVSPPLPVAPEKAQTDPPSAPTSADLMSAILQCQTSLTSTFTSKIEELKIDLSLIKQDMQNIRERTGALEERVGGVEDRTANLPQQLNEVKLQLQTVMDRIDDLENRQRRSNIRVLGLPERAEGAQPEPFAEKWLTELLGQDVFSSQFVVERAHRVPLRPLPPGAPPRKKRSSYMGVKRKLRDLGLEYAMLYPAKLKVMEGGRAHFFERPEQALEWLEQRPHNPQSPQREQLGGGYRVGGMMLGCIYYVLCFLSLSPFFHFPW
uniref:L1 transposable element RRM domain-containing protein n=1 Tax=Xenopus tropicalis TaxID=8364 RepID=A0A803JHA1_XENTR